MNVFRGIITTIFVMAANSHSMDGFIPDSTKTATKAKSMTAYLYNTQKPCNYALPVDVSSANWTCPDSIFIEALYAVRFTNVKLKLRSSDTLTIQIDSLCGLPLDVNTIYKTGTDSLSRAGKLFVIGRKR